VIRLVIPQLTEERRRRLEPVAYPVLVGEPLRRRAAEVDRRRVEMEDVT
jgi:ribosome recycling factor